MFFWIAFWDLVSCKIQAGPIPWWAIDYYARRHELNDVDDFVSIIRHLDMELMAHNGRRD